MTNCVWNSPNNPPPNEKNVLILVEYKDYLNPENKHYFIVKGFYTDGKTTTDDSFCNWDEELDLKYDEELDSYMVPEGWWESVTYSEYFGAISDFVVGWTDLPLIPDINEIKEKTNG